MNKPKDTGKEENQARSPRHIRLGNAIRLVAEENTSYVDILKVLSKKVHPREDGEDFKSNQKTKAGEYIYPH